MGRRGDEDGPSVEAFDGIVAAFCAGSRACRVPFYDLHADALKSEDQSDDRRVCSICVSCLRPNGDYMDSPLDRISRGIGPESIVWRGAKKSPSTREKNSGPN